MKINDRCISDINTTIENKFFENKNIAKISCGKKKFGLIDKIVENRKSIKYKMGLQLKSKYVPEIEFIEDNTLENYDNINELPTISNQSC